MTLNSCPFCKGKLLSLEMLLPVWGGSEKEPTVVCDDCGASAPLDTWNQKHVHHENNQSS